MSLLDREEDEENDESQGISDEPQWEWSADGAWQTLPEAKAEKEGADDGEYEGVRYELRRRLLRMEEAVELERERLERIVQRMEEMAAADAPATSRTTKLPCGREFCGIMAQTPQENSQP